jgi:hypothetical protein
MQFEAATPGTAGQRDFAAVFQERSGGSSVAASVQVEGREIYIELNANPMFRSTASDLILAINNHPTASQLVKPTLVPG